MDVRMPDGTLVRNVPEGTTKDQLLAKYNAHKQQAGATPAAPAPAPAAPTSSPPPVPNEAPGLARRTGMQIAGGLTSLLGLIPGAGVAAKEIKGAVTGEEPDYTKEIPMPGPFGATSKQVAQVESAMAPTTAALSRIAAHPSTLPGQIATAITGQVKSIIKGGLHPRNDKEAFEAGESLVNMATVVIGGKKAIDVVAESVFQRLAKNELAELRKALSEGNKAKVDEIFRGKLEEVRAEIDAKEAAVKTDSEIVKRRQEEHRRQTEDRRQAHEAHISHLNTKIDEASHGLNTKKTEELTRIRNEAVERDRKAHEEEMLRHRELHEEHQRTVEGANKELAQAREAADALANAEKLKLTAYQKRMYQRRLTKFITRTNAESAGKTVGFPRADGLAMDQPVKDSLSSRIVDFFDKRMQAEREKVKSSKIYTDLFGRIDELRENGETWGTSTPGLELLSDLKSQRWVSATAGESDTSTYLREQVRRVVAMLEHEPRPMVSEEGETIRFPPVPVQGEEVINVIRDLNRTAWQMSEAGNARSFELKGLANRIEDGLRGFVGDEFMPREKWKQLMAETNRLEQLDVPKIAVGRKGADYIPMDQRDRRVPIEKVEDQVFGNSNNINQLKSFVPPEEFMGMLDQHLSNTFSNMTSKQVREWLSGKGSWVDYVGEPALRDRIERFAVTLEKEEGLAAEAAKNGEKLQTAIEKHEENLQADIAKIEAERVKARTEAEKAARAKIKGAEVSTVGKGKEATAARRATINEARLAKTQQEEALRAALAPEEAGVKGLEAERGAARRAGKAATAAERREASQIRREVGEQAQTAERVRGDNRRLGRIADNLERVVFSQNPVGARNKFRSIKPSLVESGLMQQEEADAIERLLEEDVSSTLERKANYRARAAMRRWKETIIKSALYSTGLGVGGYGVYQALKPVAGEK